MVPPPPPRSRRRAWSLTLFAFGLLLLAAAIWLVTARSSALADAWSHARTAPAWMIAAVALLPLANLLGASAMFWIVTNRYGRVRFGEMTALLGSAWLLNMLPFKPGFVGRVAYHRAISGIPVATSLRAVAMVFALSLAGMLLTLAAAASPLPWLGPAAIGALAALTAALWLVRPTGNRSRLDLAARCSAAVLVRVIDTIMWSLRYALVFRLTGGPDLPLPALVAVAAASQIAGQFPVQLGLREWVVGLAAALAARPLGESSLPGLLQSAPGITADLVNRAAEVACALPVGLAASAWVFRRLRRAAAEGPPPGEQTLTPG